MAGSRRNAKALAALYKRKAHLWLDVGSGSNKQDGCIGMDIQKLPETDIVHDWEKMPWPFKRETFTRVLMIHVMEHVKPWLHVDIMNEMWRVLKPGGVLMMCMPYPGTVGHWQDPTHIKPWNEHTPKYFDPEIPELYRIYHPKPWKIEGCVWHASGVIEVAMRKRALGYVAVNKESTEKSLMSLAVAHNAPAR